jgi:uncharacterized protein
LIESFEPRGRKDRSVDAAASACFGLQYRRISGTEARWIATHGAYVGAEQTSEDVYVTDAIVAEYREVLSRSELRIRKGPRRQLLRWIADNSHPVLATRCLDVTLDPDDNIFLECADRARADYLVTGNPRDFPRFWKQTKIVTSREFLDLMAPHLIP